MKVDPINGTSISDYASKQAPLGVPAPTDVNSAKTEMLPITYPDGTVISVPIRYFTTNDGSICKSISKIMPIGEEILIAEYGTVDLITILQMAAGNNKEVSIAAKVCIVGVGDKVNPIFALGIGFIPKMMGEPVIRDTSDPENDMAYSRLVIKAKEDKDLFAAVTIANSKERSKVGLKINTNDVNQDVIDKMNQLKDQKVNNTLLYKGDKVKFLNYKLMHQSNISAIILL